VGAMLSGEQCVTTTDSRDVDPSHAGLQQVVVVAGGRLGVEPGDLVVGDARVAERSLHEADDHERVAVLTGQPDVALGASDVDQDRRARIRLNSTLAAANTFMTAEAVSANRRGSHTVGCTGQVIRTVGGIPSGVTNSTVIVSWGDRPICASAKGVMGEDIHGRPFRSRPWGALPREPGPLLVVTSGFSSLARDVVSVNTP
jgi:hypothetical protein